MMGSCIILRPDAPIETRTYAGLVDDDHFSDIIGGLLQQVPLFDHWIDTQGKMRECIMYVDEEARLKQLPINHIATAYWQYLLANRKMPIGRNQILFGTAIIIFGDEDFMEAV